MKLIRLKKHKKFRKGASVEKNSLESLTLISWTFLRKGKYKRKIRIGLKTLLEKSSYIGPNI